MKWIFAFALLIMAPLTFAQAPATSAPAASAAPSSPTPTPVAVAPAASAPAVSVAAPSAPPEWIQELLQTVAGLPIVGPYISKAFTYLEALGACLTALVAFLLAVSAALKGVVNFSGLTALASWIETFQQSKIMYWLTALSNIPVHVTPAQAAAPPSGQAPAAQS
jgi:hypothetical protein